MVNEDGEDLVEVIFDSRDRFDGKFEYVNGRMLLDPNQQWSIREFTSMMIIGGGAGPPVRLAVRNEYAGNINGFPVPLSQRAEFSDVPTIDVVDGKVFASKSAKYSEFALGDIEPNKCTMTAYGIPEPSLPSDRAWLLWVNLLIVCILVIAIIMRNKLKSEK